MVDSYVHWRKQCKLTAKSGCVFPSPLWTACILESRWLDYDTQSPSQQRNIDPVSGSSSRKKKKMKDQ